MAARLELARASHKMPPQYRQSERRANDFFYFLLTLEESMTVWFQHTSASTAGLEPTPLDHSGTPPVNDDEFTWDCCYRGRKKDVLGRKERPRSRHVRLTTSDLDGQHCRDPNNIEESPHSSLNPNPEEKSSLEPLQAGGLIGCCSALRCWESESF